MTDAEKASCEEWLKAHAKNWQTYKRAQWKYKWHGKTLVRFLDNVSMRELQDNLVLEYLCSADCVETLSLYSQGVSSEWTPVSAWYEIMATRGPVNGILQVRLYHALQKDVESGGDGPYTVENGCMYKVSWKFYWNQTSVISVPASSSGVNYRISNLHRNDEDGTFSYVLEKRERVQQDIDEYVRETDAFKTQSREEHRGVRGDTDEGGKAASVSLGKIVTREVSKNEDCTHDEGNTTVESKAVSGAVTETNVGLHGSVVTTVNRNMRAKADETGLNPGESVRNEENEDLTWNQTIRKISTTFRQWISGVCKKTIFRHTHSETNATGKNPGFDHVVDPTSAPGTIHELDVRRTETGWDVTDTTHTDSSVSGSVTEKRVYLDGVVETTVNANQSGPASTASIGIGGAVRNELTESGLVNQTITKAVASNVGKTGESCENTHLVHQHSTTNVLGSGSDVTVEVAAGSGQTAFARMERTERGGYRVVRGTNTAKGATASGSVNSDGVSVAVTTYRNASSIAAGASSQNVVTEATATRNEFGLLDGTKRTTTYREKEATSRGGSLLFTEETVVKDDSSAQSLAQQTPTRGTSYSTSAQKNDHGSYRVTKTTRKGIADETHKRWTSVVKGKDYEAAYACGLDVYRNQTAVPDPTSDVDAHVSVSINEMGLYDVVIQWKSLTDYKYVDRSSGGGTQWDNSKTVNLQIDKSVITKEVTEGSKTVKKKYLVYRVAKCNVRTLCSTMQNMYQEVGKNPGRPDLGVASAVHGNVAIIYTSVEVEDGFKSVEIKVS